MNADKAQPFVFLSDSLLFSSFRNLNPTQRLGRRIACPTLDRGEVRRGRPGLAGSAPSGLAAVGIPAANSLSRIFVRIGNGLNGPTDTISIQGRLSGLCCLEIRIPWVIPSTPSTAAVMPQAVNGLRNSSTP